MWEWEYQVAFLAPWNATLTNVVVPLPHTVRPTA